MTEEIKELKDYLIKYLKNLASEKGMTWEENEDDFVISFKDEQQILEIKFIINLKTFETKTNITSFPQDGSYISLNNLVVELDKIRYVEEFIGETTQNVHEVIMEEEGNE